MKSKTAAERQLAGSIIGAWITKTKADDFALSMIPVLLELEAEGITGRTEVSNALNARGYPSFRRKQWFTTTVTNLVCRIAEIKGRA